MSKVGCPGIGKQTLKRAKSFVQALGFGQGLSASKSKHRNLNYQDPKDSQGTTQIPLENLLLVGPRDEDRTRSLVQAR